MKKVYENWLLAVLEGVLTYISTTTVFQLISYLLGSNFMVAFSQSNQIFSILSMLATPAALIIALAVRKNAAKAGTIVLSCIFGLFSVVSLLFAEPIIQVYIGFYNSELLDIGARIMRIFGATMLVSAAAGLLIHAATKDRPWYAVLLILFGLRAVGLIATTLFIKVMSPYLIAIICAAADTLSILLPALRIVNTAIPESERSKKLRKCSGRYPSKSTAALLAFFLGGTGAHRYYYRRSGSAAIQTCGYISQIIGIAMLLPIVAENVSYLYMPAIAFLTFGSVTGTWAFVDFILILTNVLTPACADPYAPAEKIAYGSTESVEALSYIGRLREQGILTDEEFEAKKAILMERI